MASDLVAPLLAASVTVIVVTAVLVFMRLWIRWRLGNLGMDDCEFLAWLWGTLFDLQLTTCRYGGYQLGFVNDNVRIDDSWSVG